MQPTFVLPDDRLWTEDDLDDLPEDWKYEILDGRLLVSPRPVPQHQLVLSSLFSQLLGAIGDDLGLAWDFRLHFDVHNSRVPDLVVYRRGLDLSRASVRPGDIVLAIEVVSPSSRTDDRVRKPAEYAAAGIPYYWLVDGSVITVFALPPGGSTYATVEGPANAVAVPFPVALETPPG